MKRTPAPRKPKPLPTGSEWSFDSIERYHTEIARAARGYGLETADDAGGCKLVREIRVERPG